MKMCLILCSVLFSYALFWAGWYRIPAEPPQFVDLREHTNVATSLIRPVDRPGHYVVFCASLAENVHGFPGHCYVCWTRDPNIDLLKCDSLAYMPARFEDQIPSLVSKVDGVVIPHAARGNMRNLSKLVVAVDPATFAQSKLVAKQWDPKDFQVGVKDCVAFTNSVANAVGLRTPKRAFKFPQDYLRELRTINYPTTRPKTEYVLSAVAN
jgi:hypothetical protein